MQFFESAFRVKTLSYGERPSSHREQLFSQAVVYKKLGRGYSGDRLLPPSQFFPYSKDISSSTFPYTQLRLPYTRSFGPTTPIILNVLMPLKSLGVKRSGQSQQVASCIQGV